MYPWESAWITDGDVSNRFGDLDLITGERRQYYMYETEIHVTTGIAYAIDQYYRITDDVEFMDKYGNEMLILTALFWASRAMATKSCPKKAVDLRSKKPIDSR